MSKIRSYTSIWNVEKKLYSIGDVKLPFPITGTQILWFVSSFLIVMILRDVPPLCFIDGWFLKHLGIPVGLMLLMNKRTFDDKKPLYFLRSVCCYLFRPKVTYLGKSVRIRDDFMQKKKIVVRSEQGALSY